MHEDNDYINKGCSGSLSAVDNGGACSISSKFLSPVVGTHGAGVLWRKKTAGCWACSSHYILQMRIAKYVQIAPTAITFEVWYDRGFSVYGFGKTWWASCLDLKAGSSKLAVTCAGTSLSLLVAPAVNIYMS